MQQTVKERISEFIKFKKISLRAFESTCGLSNGYLRQLRNSPTVDKMEMILSAFPEINREWLTSGEGEMIRDGGSKSESADALIQDEDCSKNGRRKIPFYDAETTGGYEGLVSSSTTEVALRGYIDAGDWFDGKETAAIRHVGNSMVEFPDGCILALREVKERRLLIPGMNYVIETDEYRITKRVQKGSTKNSIALYSSNQEKYEDGRLIYEPFEIEVSDIRRIFRILGVIVNYSGKAFLI